MSFTSILKRVLVGFNENSNSLVHRLGGVGTYYLKKKKKISEYYKNKINTFLSINFWNSGNYLIWLPFSLTIHQYVFFLF